MSTKSKKGPRWTWTPEAKKIQSEKAKARWAKRKSATAAAATEEANQEVPVVIPCSLLGQLEKAASDKAQSSEALGEQEKQDRLVDLDAKAFQCIDRGEQANLDLGDVFNEEKTMLGHGKWTAHFAKKFAPRGIAFRTGQLYMKKANERKASEAALAKNANPALLSSAGANKPAPAKPTPAPKPPRKSRLRLDGNYNLPLDLSGDQKDNLDALRKSQNWPGAQKSIVATLDRLFVQYGLVSSPAAPGCQTTSKSGKKLELLPDEPYTATDGDLPAGLNTQDVPLSKAAGQ